jgi:phosphatidylglycerol:prolipoprotein diacylglycerol transferase
MLAEIPFIPTPRLELPFTIPLIERNTLEPFGIIVAIGVLIGMNVCLRYAKEKNLDEYMARDQMFWILVFGFIISHWISVLFYFPHQVLEDPMVLVYITNGLSSVGGFFGAFVGMNWYLWRMKQPVLVFADMNIMGLLIGETFGRLGCSIVHDHPGREVPPDTFGAMPWGCVCRDGNPSGLSDLWVRSECCVNEVWRYDLGLIEFVFLVGLCLFVYLVYNWRDAAPGKITGLVATCYGIARFTFDQFRATDLSSSDLRYLGLTPAQYFSLAFVAAGIWLWFIRKPKESDTVWALDSDRIAKEKAAEAASGETPAE